MRACNLLLTVLANFFFVPQSTYRSCTLPHDRFPPIPFALHKLISVRILSGFELCFHLSHHHLTPTMFIAVLCSLSILFTYALMTFWILACYGSAGFAVDTSATAVTAN